MPIVGGLDIHRKQITFDYLDTVTGEVRRGQIAPADREHLQAWLARFAGWDDVAFAVEGCAGWRYVTEELAAAGIAAHLGEPADTAAARGRKRHAKTDKTDARHLRTLLAEGSRKAVRFTGPDITVHSSDRKGPPGRLSRQGPPVLRWAVYEAGKTHARSSAPDHAYYAAVKDRKNSKRAALSEARKIVRQACHILTELGDDALTAA
jgi:transposase